jgi:hypothetical protein
MKTSTFRKWLCSALLVATFATHNHAARAQESTPISTSQLASVALPSGAARIANSDVPTEISSALKNVVQSGGPQVRQGQNEVIAWADDNFKKSKVTKIKSQLSQHLSNAGWQYEENSDAQLAPMTVVTALKTAPTRKALIGFWVPTDAGLLLAWTEMLPAAKSAISKPTTPTKTTAPVKTASTSSTQNSAATVLEVASPQYNINVMKGVAPPKPTFAPFAPKKGFVRGWVKDWKGKPLQGAVIGVRATAIGGAYSGASSKTDARGYYEIQVPWGVASFYCAGYTIDWGDEGRAALGLGPADGEADQFASANGAIENWVLYPYGIADRDGVAENPKYSGNYFGGTFSVYTSLSESPQSDWELPLNSTYELTLTPVGTMFDGSKGRTFVIRRKLNGWGSLFYVNNIPIGTYKLRARLLHNGETSTLNIKETGPYSNNPYGLSPKEARGEVTLTLRPYGAKAEMATAARGNWGSLDITLTR